jgi:hypothetical protein
MGWQNLFRQGNHMIQVTMQVSNELATRLKPIQPWLPTILELSLIRFKTLAATTASEIIAFLAQNPFPNEVLSYHVSDEAQDRMRRLLVLNEAGLLGRQEQLELDEYEQIEHIIIMLKAEIASQQN